MHALRRSRMTEPFEIGQPYRLETIQGQIHLSQLPQGHTARFEIGHLGRGVDISTFSWTHHISVLTYERMLFTSQLRLPNTKVKQKSICSKFIIQTPPAPRTFSLAIRAGRHITTGQAIIAPVDMNRPTTAERPGHNATRFAQDARKSRLRHLHSRRSLAMRQGLGIGQPQCFQAFD
jgi:hypothetical protein